MMRTPAEKAFDVFNVIFMCILTFFMVIAFYFVLLNSVMPEKIMAQYGYVFVPRGFTLKNYQLLFEKGGAVTQALGVSVFVTVIGTVVNLFMTLTFGYAISNRDLPLRKAIMLLVMVSIMFSAGMIPNAILVNQIGLMDNILVYIIPSALNPFYAILARNYFMDIPPSLREAALVDGAKELRIFSTIMIPLSKPMIATIGLFYAVANWNKWYEALLYVTTPKLYTMQFVLYRILSSISNMTNAAGMTAGKEVAANAEGVRFATIILTIAPIMMVYPFVQKYFIKGIMMGAVKA